VPAGAAGRGTAGVVVVGASAAGLSTAEALRATGYGGALTVLGAEAHLPYDRPPLSKQVLAGAWGLERTRLRAPAVLSALDAEFLLGDPAVALDVAGRTVHTGTGRALAADAVVLATGLTPRRLPGQDGLTGVHVLRTLDDAVALRTDLATCARLVVVGEGVLAAEIAATARKLGVAVGAARERGHRTLTTEQQRPGEPRDRRSARGHHRGADVPASGRWQLAGTNPTTFGILPIVRYIE
jgi:NADPH-dependent 2,4-dienoyl-CoA reductase/sulfur reductase-like enzyme